MRPNVLSKIHPINNNYDSEEIAPSINDNSNTTFPLYELNQFESDNQNSTLNKEENDNSNKSAKSSNKCIWILSLIIVIHSIAIGLGGYYLYRENDNKTERADKLEGELARLKSMVGEQYNKVSADLGVLNNSTERIEELFKNGGDSAIILNSKGYVSKEGVFGVQLEWSSRGAISMTEANCSLTGSYIEEGIKSFGKKDILNLESDHEYKYKITCREGESVNIISASTYTRTPLLIEDCDSLMKIGETHQTLMKNYYMFNDIDCSGQTFNPIGNTADKSFQGSLNGFNHTISNLTINTAGKSYVAIFGFCYSCSITNLKLSNSSVTGDDYTALLIGLGSKSSIENVHVNGSVTGNKITGGIAGRLEPGSIIYSSAEITISVQNDKTGGLVGQMKYESVIKESYAKGSIVVNIASKKEHGGLCGSCAASSIIDSYAHVNISAGERVGGLAGVIDNGAYIYNAYSVGVLTATLDYSPLVGVATRGAFVAKSVYWDTDVSRVLDAHWGTGLTTSQMMLKESFLYFDFHNVWDIRQNSQYPILRWQLDN